MPNSQENELLAEKLIEKTVPREKQADIPTQTAPLPLHFGPSQSATEGFKAVLTLSNMVGTPEYTIR
jgi:hypothetical protein